MTPSLLGKSTIPGRQPKTLLDHTIDVFSAASWLYGSPDVPTRFGECWLRFFRIDPQRRKDFISNLQAGCLLHDWGKANAGMQKTLRGSRDPQLFRHEHLSVLMMGCPGVASWLGQRTDIDWNLVLAAVGSHHLKFTHDFARGREGQAVQVHTDHDEFRAGLIRETARRLGLNGEPTFPASRHWGYDEDDPTVFDITKLRDGLQSKLLGVKASPLLHAVRAALIVSDAVGSGLPRTGQAIEEWLGEAFGNTVPNTAAIDQVIQSRRKHIESPTGPFKWSRFQDDCETLPDRALLLAPCGAGKTLAAWRWILGRVKERPVGRVIFLYPTRATATEGFKDYVSWAPESDAALLHGTAGYDLDGMFPDNDERSKRSFDRTDPRLFALQHWTKRIFSATVDQFFAFMSYSYGPMCLLPLLADSVLVVDECHSFDKKMFSALLGFLDAFDVPMLCMTATMQAGRKGQLCSRVGRVYDEDDQPEDLREIASTPRYKVVRIAEAEVEAKVGAAVANGKRVLWVVNQVSRAQEKARLLANLDAPVICYHSRFKLDDRVDRHRDTVAAIRAGGKAAVAISTQVCEMSLDIDADMLITEECPIPSLIQRMGRCRRGREELARKGTGEVYVYQPAEERVYSPDDLAGLKAFVDALQSKAFVSQADLEAGLEAHGAKGVEAPKLNTFLKSGGFADGGEETYREIEEFNRPAILRHEIDRFVKASKKEQPGFVVPVPRKLKPQPDSRLPAYLFVADERHYDPKTGYHDTPIQ